MKRWFLRSTVLALAAGILVVPAGRALAGPAPQTAVRTDAMAPSIARVQIAASWFSGYAIKLNGSLWAWGNNVFGQLGLGDTRQRRLPTRVGRSTGWATIAAGEHCLAVKRDGSLWSWGSNDTGQLGLGSAKYGPHPRPQRVAGADWKAVGVGVEFSVALKRDGSLWTWGNNNLGALGQGTSTEELRYWRPTRVGRSSDWKAIAVGQDWVLALKRDGSLWAWGENDSGQLGLGDKVTRKSPTRVRSSGWAKIAAGSDFSLALKANGSFWAWGSDRKDQLGLRVLRNRLVPTKIASLQ